MRNGATQREVCEELGLTRGTAYRILETLRVQGFVRKDRGSQRYWLTARVRALAAGYSEEWWVESFTSRIIHELGRKTVWPVKLLTLAHQDLLVRVATDYDSPFTQAKFPSGHRISLVTTAAGRAYLAFCEPGVREVLSDLGVQGWGNQDPYGDRRISREELDLHLTRVREQGYEIVNHPRLAIYSLAVPVIAGEQVLGVIAIQFFRASIRRSVALKRFLPDMLEAAAQIAEHYGRGPDGGMH